MADIDKSLPNDIRNTIEIPGPETLMEEVIGYQRRSP
jgi:hypothetical protein